MLRSSTALVLADPAREERPATAAETSAGQREAASWLDGLGLPPLPFAREEASSIVGALGGSRVVVGGNASERFLKTADLRSYGVLHLAAHAVVDGARPERSAVVLAPGAPEEDGLLQMREIVDLDLGGKLVVLAACRSSSGAILRGEGPLSLARAFFQAGASAVVGSLWALRDQDAAALMDGFYRALGRGEPAAIALATAQRERIAAGSPAAAWSGVVLLGDGALALEAHRDLRELRKLPWFVAGIVLVVLALLVGWRLGVRQIAGGQ
jgi:CHAT domain-containing protein